MSQLPCPFVQPDVVRLPLSNGHFIDVKRELNAGEHRRVWANMVRDGVRPGEPTVLDPERVGLAQIMEYLVGWSFCDSHGAPVPISEAAVKNLQLPIFREVMTAIGVHENEQEQRYELDRKNQTGASGLRAIS